MNTQYFNYGFMVLAGCLMLVMQPLHAAPDEAMARAQFMIRQVTAERDQLKTDKAGLEKQLAELQKKYDAMESKGSKTSGDMKQQFTQLRDLYDSERKAHEESRAAMASLLAEKNHVTDIARDSNQGLEMCIANNRKLYDLNQNLLSKYENKGVWDSLVQAEPFTGMSQIEIENMIDDAQYKLDDLRVNADLLAGEKVN
jgi:nitrate/nitrite-specific signal transduction histidine kinase